MRALDDILRAGPVIPVLQLDRIDDAAPVARALLAGGMRVIELTLRTPDALAALTAMAREVGDEAVVGAGTVLSPDQLGRAVEVGARFIVNPGLTERLARAAESAATPLLAGVATASDILRGLDLGLDRFKFFPAASSGGPGAVAAFAGPFRGVRFCPTGGVTAETAVDYLALDNVACVGGSWLAPREAIAARDWDRVTTLARAAAALVPRR